MPDKRAEKLPDGTLRSPPADFLRAFLSRKSKATGQIRASPQETNPGSYILVL